MSVLHVSQPTQFGLAQYLEALITDQAARGWTVTLASPPDEELEAVCRRAGATHQRWDAQRSPGVSTLVEVRALARVVRQLQPDVIHLHSSKAGLAGRLAVRGRRPTIFTPHAWSFLHGGRLTRRGALAWERWATRWADVILCLSNAERACGEDAGIHATFLVVDGPVDLDQFPPAQPGDRAAARARLGLSDTPLAVCVGRFVFQKGQDRLVGVWDEVRRRVPDAQLALIGEGEMHQELVGLATPGVTVVGPVDDVRPWLLAANVVVQPSRWEGRSSSVLEALASGRIVIATDVEGMREAIGEDPATRAGVIVPPNDPEALAAAIVARLLDPSVVDAEARHAAERVARYGVDPWREALTRLTVDVRDAAGRSSR
jgi:glycosyltransferase involved in cell wall biosynthesis